MFNMTPIAVQTLTLLCLLHVQANVAIAVSNRSNTCGAECLFVALAALQPDRSPPNFTEFSRRIPEAKDEGYSMATLQDVATEFGLHTLLARLTTETLDWHCRHVNYHCWSNEY